MVVATCADVFERAVCVYTYTQYIDVHCLHGSLTCIKLADGIHVRRVSP